MKTESFGFTIEKAFGNDLPRALDVAAEYEAYETYAEIPANELPSEKEVVQFLNAKAKASARAAATTKALSDAGIQKPTLENSEELRFNTIVKALVAGGIEKAAAEQQAKALTGYAG
jgi:hypothetical protein